MVENDFESLVSSDIVVSPQSHVLIQNVESQGNLRNTTKMKLIDISMKPNVIEHIHLGHNCSFHEVENYTTLLGEFHDVFVWSYK